MTISNGAEATQLLERKSEPLRLICLEFTSGAEHEFLVDKFEESPLWIELHIYNGGTVKYPRECVANWWLIAEEV